METLETKWRCAGLGTGLSAAEKQGARRKLTDNLRMGVGVGIHTRKSQK